MATPFSQTPPPDPVRGAALQGIRDRSAPAGPAPAPGGGAVPAPGGGVPDMFARLAQAIMQTGLTDEVLSAFEQFIQFFQGVVQQAGGAQQAPAQAPGPGPAGPAPGGIPGLAPGGPPPGPPVG